MQVFYLAKAELTIDTHTHSDLSPDGNDPAERLATCAAANGLDVLCITDHFEVPEKEDAAYRDLLQTRYHEILQTRQRHTADPCILAGLELGGAIYDPAFAEDLLRRYDFDFVLNSLHHIFYPDGPVDYYNVDYQRHDPQALLQDYFEKLYNQCRLGLYDSLAHIDYPTRYMRLKGIDCPLEPLYDVIDQVLRLVAQQGKALEINTSGLFADFHTTLPGLEIVKRFKALGGELITIGSDAHAAPLVGRGFANGVEIARQAGFRYIAYYKRRQPVLVKII